MVRLSAVVCAALMVACSSPAEMAQHATCEKARDLASKLIEQRAVGMTEREALADLSARGEYQMGYVVDGVFRAKPGESVAVTRDDIVRTCRKVSSTGATY